MELVDDEDVETMVDLYCGNEIDKNALIHLFAELAGMEQNKDVNAFDEEHGAQEPWMVAPISYVDKEGGGKEEGGGDHWDEEVDSDSDPDVDDVPDDIDDEDVNNDEGINASSIGEQMRRILIHNNLGPHMSLIDPNAAYVAEFPEYPEIIHPHELACLLRQYMLGSVRRQLKAAIGGYELHSLEVLRCGRYENLLVLIHAHQHDMMTIKVSVLIAEMQARFQYRVSYRKAWIAKQMAMEQLYGDYVSSYNELQGWIAVMRELAALMPRMGQQQVESYGVDLRNRRCECRRFETVHYPYAHVVVASAKVNLDVEQYVDDVYTLERTLRAWENEFPVLPDLSTWEVPPKTFELLPDRGLQRNPRGRPQSSRIRNEMDIREKSDGKRCGICRGIPIRRSTITFWATTNIIIRRRRIRPLRSSKNSHRRPNPNDSHLNPHVTVIVQDLAGAPVRALVVAENNIPQDLNPSGPLRSISQAAHAGGLQSTGLQVGSHNHLRSSTQPVVPQRHKFSVLNSSIQHRFSSLIHVVNFPHLARLIWDKLDAAKLS
ncbi:hypothetical protein GOBAR_DD18499 [Gossypium barbadense]|nr:hypothetical protein GOBAR_DD18499 [Gossypium barbadense]